MSLPIGQLYMLTIRLTQMSVNMKRQILLITLLMSFNLIFIACDKNENINPKHRNVELYLLDSYQTIGSTNQIDDKTIVSKATPFVTYPDFLAYDSSMFTFKISDAAIKSIKNLQLSVHGVAFAIKANNVLVYTGYFWPSYSSASCAWVVIDPLSLGTGNELSVELGYPGLVEGVVIPDKRNDERILEIFASDNKLIK